MWFGWFDWFDRLTMREVLPGTLDLQRWQLLMQASHLPHGELVEPRMIQLQINLTISPE
jgi:hypothetical protein